MTTEERYKEYTDQRLVQLLANATNTYYGCHGKAHRNEVICKYYTLELKRRGANIPEKDVLLETGIFNGDGAL